MRGWMGTTEAIRKLPYAFATHVSLSTPALTQPGRRQWPVFRHWREDARALFGGGCQVLKLFERPSATAQDSQSDEVDMETLRCLPAGLLDTIHTEGTAPLVRYFIASASTRTRTSQPRLCTL